MPTNTSDARAVAWIVLAVVVGIAGCRTAPHAPDRTTVATHLAQRVGHTLPSHTVSGHIALPPGASLDDDITEDAVVATAPWNNAAFQELVSLGSLVGFMTVLGIAARNGIMLVGHYRHLEDTEGMVFGPGLVRQGSEERLTPILMTTLATGLALLPLVRSGKKPGHEVEYPLAVVILGGLVTSTLLNLFLLPPLYLRFGCRTADERGV